MLDISEENLTGAVLDTLRGAGDERTASILAALVRHLHAFVREVEPTQPEWAAAIAYLTRTGHLCDGQRQEFILLSDILGVTSLIDAINHRLPPGTTENSVLGPFYLEQRPTFENGADIAEGISGEPLFFSGRVLDTAGQPVQGARVDIWHSDAQGAYDVHMPGMDGTALRGLFRSDDQGRFWLRSILPTSYPIPTDGTAGELLRAAGRPVVRPAHVHVLVNAPGFETLTTMLFVEGDPHLEQDPVFGVKSSLVRPFPKSSRVTAPDGTVLEGEFYTVDYDFVLAPAKAAAA